MKSQKLQEKPKLNEKERKPKKPFKIKASRIHAEHFYPYYYTQDMKTINLVPVMFYTRLQARYTLKKQFGPNYHQEFGVMKGRQALERMIPFGKIGKVIDGRYYQVRGHYIPPEYNYNRNIRKNFKKKLKKTLKTGKRSIINKFIKQYFLWTK